MTSSQTLRIGFSDIFWKRNLRLYTNVSPSLCATDLKCSPLTQFLWSSLIRLLFYSYLRRGHFKKIYHLISPMTLSPGINLIGNQDFFTEMTKKYQIWDLPGDPNFMQKALLRYRIRISYISKSWQSYMVMQALLVN